MNGSEGGMAGRGDRWHLRDQSLHLFLLSQAYTMGRVWMSGHQMLASPYGLRILVEYNTSCRDKAPVLLQQQQLPPLLLLSPPLREAS